MRRNQLKFPMSNHLIYSDTMFPKVLSVQKMDCTQVYMDTLGWDHFHPMKSRSEAGESLNHFVEENQWIPRTIITDGAMEEKGGSWRVNHMKWGITQQLFNACNLWLRRLRGGLPRGNAWVCASATICRRFSVRRRNA